MAEGIEVGLRLASRMHGGDLNEVSVENVEIMGSLGTVDL